MSDPQRRTMAAVLSGVAGLTSIVLALAEPHGMLKLFIATAGLVVATVGFVLGLSSGPPPPRHTRLGL